MDSQALAETITTISSDESFTPEEETEIPDADDGGVTIYDLQKGQHMIGKVKNITTFGAFVDLGISQDGLVHISEMARRKVDKVTDVVTEGDQVDVWVKKVDKKRGRISLTMVKPISLKFKDIEEEAQLNGVVTRLESYGAFVDIGSDREGLVHISQITHDYINHPQEVLTIGKTVSAKVLKVDRKKRQVDLSIKALLPPPEPEPEEEEIIEVLPPPPPPPPAYENLREEENQDEAAPTAMAIAFAAMMQRQEEATRPFEKMGRGRHKPTQGLDAVLSRTLAHHK